MEEKLLSEQKQSDYSFWFIVVLVVFLIFYTLNTSLMVVMIDGDSMNNTFYNRDVVIVTRTNQIERGDVIVFDESTHGKLIKRVIAVEGDELKAYQSKVFIKYAGTEEFIELNEDYIKDQCSTPTLPQGKIKPGELFVLGDNRGNSEDSRSFGCISVSCVNGVVSDYAIKNKDFTTKIFSWLFA